jgi:hypothetical protein
MFQNAFVFTLNLCFMSTHAMMYDVIESVMTPPSICTNGCASWIDLASDYNTANQSIVNSLWISQDAQALAGSSCSMPANFIGQPGLVKSDGPVQSDFDFSFGPQCYCKGTPSLPTAASGYCQDPAVPTPQQINLQFGMNEHELTVAFVTVDNGAPILNPPRAEFCSGLTFSSCKNVTGYTNRFTETQNSERVLSFHFVTLPAPLQASTMYSYRVIGGTVNSVWSDVFNFKTRSNSVSTKFAMAGDLGIYPYNCFQNLLDDSSISFFVHLGDHAYNLEMGGGARGDSYMMGFQRILSTIPMGSVIGNHELEGSPFGAYCPKDEFCQGRYLNQTAGQLRIANSSGSFDNRYFSIDIGIIHFIILDVNNYIGLEDQSIADRQLVWLDADLKRAASSSQRQKVPWIIVCSHVPMYSSSGNNAELIKDIEPLLLQYHVDIYATGHQHIYESEWPIGPNGHVASKSFVNPTAPVHVITGAGAAPAFGSEGPIDQELAAKAKAENFTRLSLYIWSYSVVEAFNASVLTFQQIDNTNSSVIDTWTIVK